MAQIGAPTRRCHSWSWTPGRIWLANGEAATPARKSRESPGKKKPTNSPVSANRMASTPIVPNAASSSAALSGLIARVAVAVSTANQGTGPSFGLRGLGSATSQPWVDRLGLAGQDGEDHLVDPPQ